MLEGAGIPAFVADDHLISTQWLYSTALGGVKLQVVSEDLEAARDLLDRHGIDDLATIPESQQPPADGDICPSCTSSEIRGSQVFRSSLALSLLAQVPLFAWRRRWVCEACGYSWRMSRSLASARSVKTLDAEEAIRGHAGSYTGVRLTLAFLAAVALLYHVLRQPTESW